MKYKKPLKQMIAELEADYITQVIVECGFNKTKAAEHLQIDRKSLYNKLNAVKFYKSAQ